MNKYLFSLFYRHDNKTFSPIRFAKIKKIIPSIGKVMGK